MASKTVQPELQKPVIISKTQIPQSNTNNIGPIGMNSQLPVNLNIQPPVGMTNANLQQFPNQQQMIPPQVMGGMYGRRPPVQEKH